MDYKGMIEQIRSFADRWKHGEQLLLNGELRLQDALRDAATSLEALLAERDAAVTLMHGECFACKNKSIHYSDEPCSLCKWGAMRSMVPVVTLQDSWEWRGPQKEGTT